jgi:hypothetical protein
MGLAHMYQYADTGKVYGDMPLPIDKHNTLKHVGGNANRIKPYASYKGMTSMSSNLGGLCDNLPIMTRGGQIETE